MMVITGVALLLLAVKTGYAQFNANCGVKEEDFNKASKTVLIIGDRDAFIPTIPTKDMDAHCKNMSNRFETLKTYALCQESFLATAIGSVVSGMERETADNCKTPRWKTEYTNAMFCLSKTGKLEAAHKCMDKLTASLAYNVQNLPANRQMSSSCCPILLFTNCLFKSVESACGSKCAVTILDMVKHNIGLMFGDVCSVAPSLSQCWFQIPDEMKKYETIFKTSDDYAAIGLLELVLKMLFNQVA